MIRTRDNFYQKCLRLDRVTSATESGQRMLEELTLHVTLKAIAYREVIWTTVTSLALHPKLDTGFTLRIEGVGTNTDYMWCFNEFGVSLSPVPCGCFGESWPMRFRSLHWGRARSSPFRTWVRMRLAASEAWVRPGHDRYVHIIRFRSDIRAWLSCIERSSTLDGSIDFAYGTW